MKSPQRTIQSPGDISQLFDDFHSLRVMIVGDVMVDAYVFGNVNRISPEAPVPVVAVKERVNRLGGAANVALNVHALGATPLLVSVIGNDLRGKEFTDLLHASGMPVDGIIHSTERITTTKFRIMGNKVQMLRVDDEMTHDISAADENKLLVRVEQLLREEQVDVIVLQDYNKGVLTAGSIHHIIRMAHERNVPVTVDPKKKHFLAYTGATLFKPNLKELKEGLSLNFDGSKPESIQTALTALMNQLQLKSAMATLSEKGVLMAWISDHETHFKHINAHLRNIADVSGAGDTVISVASLCLALGIEFEWVAELSNLAGGLVCEQIGVVPVDKNNLKTEALKVLSKIKIAP